MVCHCPLAFYPSLMCSAAQLSAFGGELAQHGLTGKWLMKEGKTEIRARTRRRVQPQRQAPAGQASDELAALQQRIESLLAAQYPPVIEGAPRTGHPSPPATPRVSKEWCHVPEYRNS